MSGPFLFALRIGRAAEWLLEQSPKPETWDSRIARGPSQKGRFASMYYLAAALIGYNVLGFWGIVLGPLYLVIIEVLVDQFMDPR